MSLVNYEGWTSNPAAADYSAVKWPRLVQVNSSGQYALCAAGGFPHGIADSFPVVAGEHLRAATVHGWLMKAEVGAGGVTRGAKVYSDAAGRLVASATAGHIPVGIASETRAAGEVAQFLFVPQPANA